MCCSCGCGLALAMAEAEEKARRVAAGLAPGEVQERCETAGVASASSVRGWEALKAALRHVVGHDRSRALPHIASAA